MPAQNQSIQNPLTPAQKSRLQAMAYRLSQLQEAIQKAAAVGMPVEEFQLASQDQDRKIQLLLQTYFGQQQT